MSGEHDGHGGAGGPAGGRGAVVVSEVVVPVLQALGIGTLLGFALGGTTLFFGATLATAGVVAGAVALWGTAISGVLFVGQQRMMAITPSWVARQRVLLEMPEVEPEAEEPWRVINRRPVRPALGPGTMAHEVPVVGPTARPEIEEAHGFICALWPGGDIRQETVCARFSRRLYDKYIGGSRRRRDRGTEGGRGVLDRAGLIEKDGQAWVICSTLEEALSWNPELRAYADAKARVVTTDGGNTRWAGGGA